MNTLHLLIKQKYINTYNEDEKHKRIIDYP